MKTIRVILLVCVAGVVPATAANPDFYRDILPVLHKRCAGCHGRNSIAGFSLLTYNDVRPWVAAIREAVTLRKMPPWFADPSSAAAFSNDPRLPDSEIALLQSWIASGAPEGRRPKNLSSQPASALSAFSPDLTLSIPHPFPIRADSTIDYQYFVLRLPFTYDRWVRGVEVSPSDRAAVHHAVVYVRPPSSAWLRNAPPDGRAWSPPAEALPETRATKEEILTVYVPGSGSVVFPRGMAKKIPAGSDLVLQIHYTSRKEDTSDQTSVGLLMSPEPPKKRLLTLQMGRDDIRIPPGSRDHRLSVSGTLPRDTTLVSLTPHMHLRGAAFDFELFSEGKAELLLRVKPYDFFWQYTYQLAEPRVLPKGAILKWTGYFDNSRNNPRNPDPQAEVRWGEQSWEEMMIGFFEVAVDPAMDKDSFFRRE